MHGSRSAWGGEIGGLLVINNANNYNENGFNSSQHFTNSLDSFNIKKKSAPPLIQALRKENTSINLKAPNQNFVSLPKIQSQKSVEA